MAKNWKKLTYAFIVSLCQSAGSEDDFVLAALTGGSDAKGVVKPVSYNVLSAEDPVFAALEWRRRVVLFVEDASELESEVFYWHPDFAGGTGGSRLTPVWVHPPGSTPRVFLLPRARWPGSAPPETAQRRRAKVVGYSDPRLFQDETLGRLVVRDVIVEMQGVERDVRGKEAMQNRGAVSTAFHIRLPVGISFPEELVTVGLTVASDKDEVDAVTRHVNTFIDWLLVLAFGDHRKPVKGSPPPWSVTVISDASGYTAQVAFSPESAFCESTASQLHPGCRFVYGDTPRLPDRRPTPTLQELAKQGTMRFGFDALPDTDNGGVTLDHFAEPQGVPTAVIARTLVSLASGRHGNWIFYQAVLEGAETVQLSPSVAYRILKWNMTAGIGTPLLQGAANGGDVMIELGNLAWLTYGGRIRLADTCAAVLQTNQEHEPPLDPPAQSEIQPQDARYRR